MKLLFSLGIALYRAKGMFKVYLIASSGFILTPLLEALQKFLTPNFENVGVVVILLFLDTLCGVFKHSGLWDKDAPNTLDRNEFFYKFISKLFASVVWLFLINIFERFTDLNELTKNLFNGFSIAILISWYAWSIGDKLHTITKGGFPPISFLKRLGKDQNKKYNQTIKEHE
jgi:hypothetical protein